jgi:hypothetical protein
MFEHFKEANIMRELLFDPGVVQVKDLDNKRLAGLLKVPGQINAARVRHCKRSYQTIAIRYRTGNSVCF